MGLETFQAGDYRKAEREFAEAASRSWIANGHDDLLTLRAQRWMSNAIVRQGRVAEAASILLIISPIQREAHGEEHADYLSTKYELASALLDQGKAAEAEAALRDLLPVEERVSDAEHPDTLSTRYEIARALLAQGKATEAEAMLRDLLPLEERVSGADHPHTLVTRCRLAKAVFAQGRVAEAVDDLEALAPLAARVLAETDSHLGYIAFLRAQCADALGVPSAAVGFLAEAEANWGDRLTPEHPFRREFAVYLATRTPPQ